MTVLYLMIKYADKEAAGRQFSTHVSTDQSTYVLGVTTP